MDRYVQRGALPDRIGAGAPLHAGAPSSSVSTTMRDDERALIGIRHHA